MTLFIYEGFGQKVLMYYFALLLMKNIPQPYSLFHRVSAIMMIVALSWLTISAPFVYEQQQKIAKENSSGFANLPIAGTDEEANPFSGSTEEKAPKTLNTFSEEYLHDHHQSEYGKRGTRRNPPRRHIDPKKDGRPIRGRPSVIA